MRKTKDVVVALEGRDKGKVFRITEMPASQAEKWATRAFLALAHSGVEVPEYVSGAGMAGIAVLGLKALGGVSFEEAEPLMDEMMACVTIVRDPKQPMMAFGLMEQDTEEVSTRVLLRGEVFELHTGFSFAAEKWTSTSAATTTETDMPPTPTGQEHSGQ